LALVFMAHPSVTVPQAWFTDSSLG